MPGSSTLANSTGTLPGSVRIDGRGGAFVAARVSVAVVEPPLPSVTVRANV